MNVASTIDGDLQDQLSFLRRASKLLEIRLEPLVDVSSGRLVACEALMRGVDRIGFSNPFELLQQAEKLDVISQLDLKLACAAIDTVSLVPHSKPILFVNIDGRSLKDWERYRDRLYHHLMKRGLPPSKMCIEISEAHQVLYGDDLVAAVEGLREAGLRLAIDDYGVGLSGMQMLYLVKPDYIKIDRFFVQSIHKDPSKRLMVRAMAELANTLGATVIAEGIETTKELNSAVRSGCAWAQGYLFKSNTEAHGSLDSAYPVPRRNLATERVDSRITDMLQRPRAFRLDASIKSVFEHYQTGEVCDIIPIVDPQMILKGGVVMKNLNRFLGSRYAHALAANPGFQFRIEHLLEPVPTVDVAQPISEAIDLVADRAQNGVIVLDQREYCGYLSPFDLMQLANSVQIEVAQRLNPLTKLPGNDIVNEIVRSFGSELWTERLAAYIDIANFKPFNDEFGFDLGDRAIRLLADQIKRVETSTAAKVGHIGGDDFFVGATGDQVNDALVALKNLPDLFAESVGSLVPSEVKVAGRYEGKSRNGPTKEVPIPSCTVVCLRFSAGYACPTPDQVARDLTNLRRQTRHECLPFHVEYLGH